MNKIFKFIIIFSAFISCWTSVVLISNTNFELEIKEVINKMYSNQKNFISNVKELSILLLQDANDRFSKTNHRNTFFKSSITEFKK